MEMQMRVIPPETPELKTGVYVVQSQESGIKLGVWAWPAEMQVALTSEQAAALAAQLAPGSYGNTFVCSTPIELHDATEL